MSVLISIPLPLPPHHHHLSLTVTALTTTTTTTRRRIRRRRRERIAMICFSSTNASCSLAAESAYNNNNNGSFQEWPRRHFLSLRNMEETNGRGSGAACSAFAKSPAMVSAVKDLYEFICSGPLMSKIGWTSDLVEESIDEWVLYGSYLCRLLGRNELDLSMPDKIRIYHYYIPVFVWCQREISNHKSLYKDVDEIPPLVIGISAPQGSGKTTLVFALDYLFRVTGRNSATISIDDFYLTAEDQAKLHSDNPGNPLLELRGNAGSHDLNFSMETLNALCVLTKGGQKMKLPRYDKSAYGGKGDRADPSTWPEVEGPLEVVLFEGWMLGFKPRPADAVNAVDQNLDLVNKILEHYYDAWDKFIKSWIVIKIEQPEWVYQWRLQAELAMRADGKPGMSDEEVMDFVSRYMPAYKAYLPTLYEEGPSGADVQHLLVVEIDKDRNPV